MKGMTAEERLKQGQEMEAVLRGDFKGAAGAASSDVYAPRNWSEQPTLPAPRGRPLQPGQSQSLFGGNGTFSRKVEPSMYPRQPERLTEPLNHVHNPRNLRIFEESAQIAHRAEARVEETTLRDLLMKQVMTHIQTEYVSQTRTNHEQPMAPESAPNVAAPASGSGTACPPRPGMQTGGEPSSQPWRPWQIAPSAEFARCQIMGAKAAVLKLPLHDQRVLPQHIMPVSYTHLTLPTILLV